MPLPGPRRRNFPSNSRGTTAERSLWRRRHRAIGGFLVGYVGTWMLFGVAASFIVAALRVREWQPSAVAVGFGAALLWQVTPIILTAV